MGVGAVRADASQAPLDLERRMIGIRSRESRRARVEIRDGRAGAVVKRCTRSIRTEAAGRWTAATPADERPVSPCPSDSGPIPRPRRTPPEGRPRRAERGGGRGEDAVLASVAPNVPWVLRARTPVSMGSSNGAVQSLAAAGTRRRSSCPPPDHPRIKSGGGGLPGISLSHTARTPCKHMDGRPHIVMPGLVPLLSGSDFLPVSDRPHRHGRPRIKSGGLPAIHVPPPAHPLRAHTAMPQDVDARNKSGHDEKRGGTPRVNPSFDSTGLFKTRLKPSHAPCPPNLNRTAMGLSRPSTWLLEHRRSWLSEMAGTSPAMTREVDERGRGGHECSGGVAAARASVRTPAARPPGT